MTLALAQRLADPRPLAVGEVAELLSVSPDTVRREVSRGQLRALRIGRRLLRIEPAEVARYLAARAAVL